jgi:GNAT superfamily N-acetyltransferase
MQIDITKSVALPASGRVSQLSAMFDVPIADVSTLSWKGDFPYDDAPWNVGLIVGPSGCGKSTIMQNAFGGEVPLTWSDRPVIEDFAAHLGIAAITNACSAVGFNTIPAWMRPHGVLSNGEKFRCELARRILELPDPVVVDEFTSVVDRQVAKIASHAVQKYVRREGRKFVAVTCHYDVVDWLQPDWIFEPATMTFTRRLLQRRPTVDVDIRRVPYRVWQLFSPYHYMNADLHRAARCIAAHVDGRPVAFAGMLHRPHPKVQDVTGCSRLVTLPDWQGMGLAMALIDVVGSAYKALGRRLHTYPAHPSLIRTFAKSPRWVMRERPGFTQRSRKLSTHSTLEATAGFGGRPNAVFRYNGDAMDKAQADALLNGELD